jgi:phage-related protein
VTRFFSGAAGWLVAAGQAIMNGLLSGLQSMWGKIQSFVSGIAGWIKSHKGPLDYDRQLLVQNGQAIMDGLNAGLNSRMGQLRGTVGGINSALAGAGAGHWVSSTGAGMVAAHGGAMVDGAGSSIHGSSAGGGSGDVHVTLHLDGRQIYSGVQKQAVTTQRRTGYSGMGKRTR